MNKRPLVLLLSFVVIAAVFFRPCEHSERIRTTTGEVVGVLTTTKAAVTGGRNKTSYAPLSRSEVDGVEKFVLFIGYGRSGHSLIGAMMDAHPNIVIAHEYHVLKKCALLQQPKLKSKATIFNGLYENSYSQSKYGWRSESKRKKGTKKGYNLHINTKWQGSFSQLRVIGDKDGGCLGESFSDNPMSTIECFNMLKETIKIPIVMFFVVRNPFDIIATRLALHHDILNTREMILEGKRLRLEKEEILKVVTSVFHRAEAILEFTSSDTLKDVVIVEIHIENFIMHPREHIHKICEALDIPCPVKYVEACHEKAFANVSRSRQIIEWNNDVVESIMTRMKNFPFFSSYTFDSGST